MAKPGPQKINRYGVDFKLRAVQMSHQPGVLVKDVAESLCVHPFMLSLWRRQVRNGELKYVPKADLLLRRAAAASRNVRPRNPSL
jgi:transposase